MTQWAKARPAGDRVGEMGDGRSGGERRPLGEGAQPAQAVSLDLPAPKTLDASHRHPGPIGERFR
ncbi:MAG TPA: hypothetical protein VGO81_13760 [Solirubrobacteraceae bacterium]|nr:hypothetical protein [Solirubrobacteraceae bacterium]